jgi:hypothetical protein
LFIRHFKTQGIFYTGIICELNEALMGGPGFLFCGEVFMQAGDWVARDLDVSGRPGDAGGVCRVNGVVVLGKVSA